jgi:hypothetical protein
MFENMVAKEDLFQARCDSEGGDNCVVRAHFTVIRSALEQKLAQSPDLPDPAGLGSSADSVISAYRLAMLTDAAEGRNMKERFEFFGRENDAALSEALTRVPAQE